MTKHVHRAVACLRPSFCWYSLWLARLSWPGWLVTRLPTVTHLSTNRARRRLTLLMWPTTLNSAKRHRFRAVNAVCQKLIEDRSQIVVVLLDLLKLSWKLTIFTMFSKHVQLYSNRADSVEFDKIWTSILVIRGVWWFLTVYCIWFFN